MAVVECERRFSDDHSFRDSANIATVVTPTPTLPEIALKSLPTAVYATGAANRGIIEQIALPSQRRNAESATETVGDLSYWSSRILADSIPTGHIAKECPENRLLLQLKALNLGEVSAKDAWDMLGKADEDKEIEDFKRVCYSYDYSIQTHC